MADASIRKKGDTYQVRIRWNDEQREKSLKTGDKTEAEQRLAEIKLTLKRIDECFLTVPHGVEAFDFILSGGRLQNERQQITIRANTLTVKQACERFEEISGGSSKEANSKYTEKVHMRRLRKVLGDSTPFGSLTFSDLQRYADLRRHDKGRYGRPIKRDTVEKELATFRLIWNAVLPADRKCPLRNDRGQRIDAGKSQEKQPFMTFAEVCEITENGVNRNLEKELWERVFLNFDEIAELLRHVRRQPGEPYRYPLFVAAATTGARPSELLRAEREDFRLSSGVVVFREKKKSQDRYTHREISISAPLGDAMREWFGR